ncbi:MAG TPA: hypothetical protein VIM49_06485 [Dermatophilaceae bacterium]|jgi:hypothetical protein
MPPPSAVHPSVGSDPLLALFQEVTSAREAMVVARRAPLGTPGLIEGTRTRLLRALEAYAAELDARHLPVPYGIHDDIRIQRRTLGKPFDRDHR